MWSNWEKTSEMTVLFTSSAAAAQSWRCWRRAPWWVHPGRGRAGRWSAPCRCSSSSSPRQRSRESAESPPETWQENIVGDIYHNQPNKGQISVSFITFTVFSHHEYFNFLYTHWNVTAHMQQKAARQGCEHWF